MGDNQLLLGQPSYELPRLFIFVPSVRQYDWLLKGGNIRHWSGSLAQEYNSAGKSRYCIRNFFRKTKVYVQNIHCLPFPTHQQEVLQANGRAKNPILGEAAPVTQGQKPRFSSSRIQHLLWRNAQLEFILQVLWTWLELVLSLWLSAVFHRQQILAVENISAAIWLFTTEKVLWESLELQASWGSPD